MLSDTMWTDIEKQSREDYAVINKILDQSLVDEKGYDKELSEMKK